MSGASLKWSNPRTTRGEGWHGGSMGGLPRLTKDRGS